MSRQYSPHERDLLIYYGTPIFAAGVLGGILSTLVFVSLRTFRESSCAFYLTISSIVNVVQLFTGLLSRILAAFIGSSGTEKSLFYCKTRYYLFQVCMTVSMTCFCLAIIDQYCTTCTRARWRQFCNIQLAQRLVIASVILSSLHCIPYLIFYNHVTSKTTNQTTCSVTDLIFAQYRSTFILSILIGYLPIIIATIFGILACRNVQQMAYRTVPHVRRQLDRQLTVMVLVQVIVGIFTILPYTTINAIANNVDIANNADAMAKLQFALTVTVLIYYTYFSSGFYIYMCASERYRRQLIYVLFTKHFRRWLRLKIVINQITPENREL